MGDGTSEIFQRKLHLQLPKILCQLVDDYTAFAGQSAPNDAKNFGQHQTAGKAAVAHLLALTKLVTWIEKQGATHDRTDQTDFESLLRQARATLLSHNSGEDHDQEKDQL